VVDASGSTASPSGGDCGPDQNPTDPEAAEDEIIDCEIAATINLNNQAVTLGTVGEVAMTVFAGSSATADATPAGGDDPIIAPGADANVNLQNDVDEVMHSVWVAEFGGETGGFNQFSAKPIGDLVGTDYADAASQACALAAVSTKPSKMVVFISDGVANAGADITTVLPCDTVPFFTFAVGPLASCAGDPSGLGSLQEIADLTGGTCTPVADPANLPDVLPDVITAKLLSLSYVVDGGAPVAIDNAFIDPDLPIEDPVSADFEGVDVPLSPGIHEVCVRATGSDVGGVGSLDDCITVTIVTIDLAPETASNELGTPGQQHTVTATVAAGADGGVSGVPVDFEILLGPNAGATATDVATDVNGEAEFTYTAVQGLAGLGTDTIEACYGPDEQGDTICDTATKEWVDTTPPEVACLETVNPAGKKVPPAGSTTLPGPKGGQNEDGFYELTATDAVDPDPLVYVMDSGSGTVFGPFVSGVRIKYTQDPDAIPTQQTMGGPNSAIDWHIMGTGDAILQGVDFSGNVGTASCLVPPPPN